VFGIVSAAWRLLLYPPQKQPPPSPIAAAAARRVIEKRNLSSPKAIFPEACLFVICCLFISSKLFTLTNAAVFYSYSPHSFGQKLSDHNTTSTKDEMREREIRLSSNLFSQ
jgi:hypothetical protein